MSADGPGLFDDDTAVDVRGEFTELLAKIRDPVAATREFLEGWKDFIARPSDATVFWLSLAAVQWRLGCLQADVQQHALDVIDSGADLRLWAGRLEATKRASVLRRLRGQLVSPPRELRLPSPKRRKAPPRLVIESPGGALVAEAYQMGKTGSPTMSTVVMIHHAGTGTSPIQVECALSEVEIAWPDESTLRVRYPRHARTYHRYADVTVESRTIRVEYERRDAE
jgi:hypothetical protein